MSQEVAQKLNDRSKKTVKLEDGLEVRIRKVSKYELMSAGVLGPAIAASMEDDKATPSMGGETKFATNADSWGKVLEATVSKGMDDPKVWQGLEAKKPKDQVMLYALSEWMELLFNEILGLSGFDAEVTNAASFPDSEKEGAEADQNDESDRAKSSPAPTL